MKKELDNLKNKGFAIVDIENIKLFDKLKKNLVNKLKIAQVTDKNILTVRKKIARMSKTEVNKSMISLLKNSNLSEMMINAFPKLVKKLCTKKLFIQRRATIIMNLPGKGQPKQWPHYELMSGISPFTYVIWAPLHDLEDKSGVYYLDLKKSLKIMKKRSPKVW